MLDMTFWGEALGTILVLGIPAIICLAIACFITSDEEGSKNEK